MRGLRWALLAAVVLSLMLGPVALAASSTDMDVIEKQTADAAFAASDHGKPDPSWAGKRFTIAVLASGPRGALSGPLYF